MGEADDGTPKLISNKDSGNPPLERKPDGEDQAIATILQLVTESVANASSQAGVARRDAHAKAHGCVHAQVQVLDGLRKELRIGLFSAPKTYEAWIRFSNGSGTPQPDNIGDGRGMAVKVMGVDHSLSGTQDLIMINNPAFFVRNAVDYVEFQGSSNQLRFFLPSWNPFRFRLHEMFVALAITRRRVSNPLNCQYWSMTPYMFGDRACKFTVLPMDSDGFPADRSSPDFLRKNLVSTLENNTATFEFCVQLQTDPKKMPVEDPTIEWSEADSPFEAVARITINKQLFDTVEQNQFGENLSFTPWHGLEAHRPLGGINRVRRAVYEAVSRLRHQINRTVRAEP